MLERVWRRGNPLALPVGMHIDAATLENSRKGIKKLGIKLTYDPTVPPPGICAEEAIAEND